MRKILRVSAGFVFPGGVGGAEFYLYNLVRGLSATDVIRTEVYSRVPLPDLRGLPNVTNPVYRHWWGNRFLTEAAYSRMLATDAEAVLYPNYYTPARHRAACATVIFDFQYAHFPDNFSSRKRAWLKHAHRKTLRVADSVIVLTNFVRDDLLRIYGAEFEDKVTVIPCPVSWERFPEGSGAECAAAPYLLTVAAHWPHKNLATAIKGLALARKRRADMRLVIVGQFRKNLRGMRFGGPDLASLVAELGLSEAVTLTGHIEDRDLGFLYRGAAAFFLPSLFEGIGMPAIEALGMGVPTILARTTALPEVSQGLAAFVDDPLSPSAWADAFDGVFSSGHPPRPSTVEVEAFRKLHDPKRVAQAYLRTLGL